VRRWVREEGKGKRDKDGEVKRERKREKDKDKDTDMEKKRKSERSEERVVKREGEWREGGCNNTFSTVFDFASEPRSNSIK
jgi:hypothetical protein